MPSTHDDLRHIAAQWPALRELLQTRTPSTWPPAGRMADHQRDLEDVDAEHYEAALERAERTALAPGQRPAPLRVDVLDTITALEEELLGLADEIAGTIQRPAFTTSFRSASPNDDVARSLALAGLKDQQDPRRWRFNMAASRTGARAAEWLAGRIDGDDGPFRPLSDIQRARIGLVATSCRRRLDRALGDLARADHDPTGLVCECGGQLTVSNEAADFTVQCSGCPAQWSGTELLDRLRAA
ncbi:hypothetical protein [Kitasatospora sp. NPDC056181]|uniref:hypothetical protein n=1 Tax=Kitasatospora sp. NPDC056181 TaxID=3345737 RepID=UPI0035DCF9A9